MSTDIINVEATDYVAPYEPLTQAEDTFALAVVEYGGHIGSAYKAVFGDDSPYPVSRGKELLSKPQVALRIKEITDKIDDSTLITKGSHLYELADIRELAKATGQLKVALSAERNRGEVAGLYDQVNTRNMQNNVQINLVSKFDNNI